ncbi:hypothetical protein GLAREA_08761 [Glarea lozoyensis ATCC 20868]|uniref:Uncharacterized protein n=1 Tax=Glarea lozoyensis (strain ATCC 20868 / MF5171) TaxID=1116229 RepID=S3EEB5_GLAL2|nr:uncharacterized protein GLAREA_08761 [Glarea lozoyensis ATCC 20868]EPE36598.1 hypothetical protein GLAREA_08761 [Glarea lozoyensis ATCC 20868]
MRLTASDCFGSNIEKHFAPLGCTSTLVPTPLARLPIRVPPNRNQPSSGGYGGVKGTSTVSPGSSAHSGDKAECEAFTTPSLISPSTISDSLTLLLHLPRHEPVKSHPWPRIHIALPLYTESSRRLDSTGNLVSKSRRTSIVSIYFCQHRVDTAFRQPPALPRSLPHRRVLILFVSSRLDLVVARRQRRIYFTSTANTLDPATVSGRAAPRANG